MKYVLSVFLMVAGFTAGLVAQSVGTIAPDFTHSTLSNGTISLSDYRGKVVYLFFFGWD